MNKLETLKDIIADKYDGCYEVTRECVKAYANVDTALLDLKDLDLVLMIPIGTWAVQNEKKKELVYASHLDVAAKERIASLMDVVNQKSIDGEYEHTQENTKDGYWGMFGTAFRSVTAVCKDVATAKDFIAMLVAAMNTPEDKLYALVGSTIKNKPLVGLQAGVISQVLHCLFPTAFPVLNSWGRDIYDALRLRLVSAGKKENYIHNCETIRKYRDKFGTFKNYRVLDSLTIEEAHEIGFGFFVERYSNPKAILGDIDNILPKYLSKLTEDYNSLYQIPDAETAKEVQTILRADKGFMKKSEATGRHRPSSCFKKYMDFFDWWMNPEDPLEQHEDQDDDKYP